MDDLQKSVDQASKWANQSRTRLEWLIETYSTELDRWPDDLDIDVLAQLGILLSEQERLLAVLAYPDADERNMNDSSAQAGPPAPEPA